MNNLFELEQKVEVVETIYRQKHLAVGSFGIVKDICPPQDGPMYELRMDEDVEGGTWPFFGYELKAVKQANKKAGRNVAKE